MRILTGMESNRRRPARVPLAVVGSVRSGDHPPGFREMGLGQAPAGDWEWEDGERAYLTPEAEDRFTRLHVETMTALPIVLASGEFRPGRYKRKGLTDWKRDESGQ